jgi:hypothetical protein
LAQSGHHSRLRQCPLSGVKRTSRIQSVMSAFDPKRTWHVYHYAITEFLFDLNQIQNFRL